MGKRIDETLSEQFLYQGTIEDHTENTQLAESLIAQIARIATTGRLAAQKRTNHGNERLRTDRPKRPRCRLSAQSAVSSATAGRIINEMSISISAGLTDDNDFVDLLNTLLNALLVQQTPEQLWVIQIDNWFDHKWLRYSGSGTVGAPFPANWTSSFMDRFTSVKEQFWRDKLTFPPFAPNRVVGQRSFLRSEAGYAELPLPKLPHKESRQHSHSNLNRRVEDFIHSASFVWYSENTLKNGRGSVMVYHIGTGQPICWFAAFGKKSRWVLESTKGIHKEQVSRLLMGE